MWPQSSEEDASSTTMRARFPSQRLRSRDCHSGVAESRPVAVATTFPSTTTLTEVFCATGLASASDWRTSSSMMCPHAPVPVRTLSSTTRMVALRPLRSETFHDCQLSVSVFSPVAERTTSPSTTSSTTVRPVASPSGWFPPPMLRLR